MIKNEKFIFIAVNFLLILTSCSGDSNEADVVFHPVYENLPYSDVPAQMLELADAGEQYERLPDQIQLFYNQLNDEFDNSSTQKLNIISSSHLEFASVNDSTLLLLDKDQDQLIEYNLNSKEDDVIAVQGRGPGDLYFAETLAFHDGKAYVGMQGFQISVFNCQTGRCEHERVIKTDYNNYTVSLSDDFVYFLGIAPFGGENNSIQSSTDQFSIHKMNVDGELNASFFPMYKHQSPLVRNGIMKSGKIAMFQQLDKVIVSLSRTPFLFVLDLDGEIIEKLELPDFIKPMNFHSTRLNENHYTTTHLYEGDYSYINSISRFNDHWLFIQTNEYRNMNYSQSEGITGSSFMKYFALNLNQNNLYSLGRETAAPFGTVDYTKIVGKKIINNVNGDLKILE